MATTLLKSYASETAEKTGGAILLETADMLRGLLGGVFGALTVERVVIGLFFTGVKLSNGEGGLCATPVKDIPEAVCCPSSLRAMPSSGKLIGTKAADILEKLYQGPLHTAVGIAVLNALSETFWKKEPDLACRIQSGAEPIEEMDIPEEAEVAVIGALAPYLRMLMKRNRPFHILEKDPRTLKASEMEFFCPEEKADECIASSDILIITGTTLINRTLEDILAKTKKGAKSVLVGPTASMLPEAFFKRGISAIGGIRVTKPDELLNVLAEAGSGYHFFGRSAEKTVLRPVGG